MIRAWFRNGGALLYLRQEMGLQSHRSSYIFRRSFSQSTRLDDRRINQEQLRLMFDCAKSDIDIETVLQANADALDGLDSVQLSYLYEFQIRPAVQDGIEWMDFWRQFREQSAVDKSTLDDGEQQDYAGLQRTFTTEQDNKILELMGKLGMYPSPTEIDRVMREVGADVSLSQLRMRYQRLLKWRSSSSHLLSNKQSQLSEESAVDVLKNYFKSKPWNLPNQTKVDDHQKSRAKILQRHLHPSAAPVNNLAQLILTNQALMLGTESESKLFPLSQMTLKEYKSNLERGVSSCRYHIRAEDSAQKLSADEEQKLRSLILEATGGQLNFNSLLPQQWGEIAARMQISKSRCKRVAKEVMNKQVTGDTGHKDKSLRSDGDRYSTEVTILLIRKWLQYQSLDALFSALDTDEELAQACVAHRGFQSIKSHLTRLAHQAILKRGRGYSFMVQSNISEAQLQQLLKNNKRRKKKGTQISRTN
ncbi:hypothetical protein MP228_006347 [Amoeboaphelidium protococcarum]|nr:hypothetical protein MP228_006347 [Amoeboaphelidium protococcarum]